jgi:hypothetical protein
MAVDPASTSHAQQWSLTMRIAMTPENTDLGERLIAMMPDELTNGELLLIFANILYNYDCDDQVVLDIAEYLPQAVYRVKQKAEAADEPQPD